MKNLFALFPLFSVILLLTFPKDRFRVRVSAIILFSSVSLVLGFAGGMMLEGFMYALIFVAIGLFPLPLQMEIKDARENHRIREKQLTKDVAVRKSNYEEWINIKAKVLDELDRILNRYTFAKTLVSQTDEKSILLDLSSIFESKREVKGFAFSMSRDSEKGGKGKWDAQFTSGWIMQENWKNILRGVPIEIGSADQYTLSNLNTSPRTEEKDMSLVSAPVRRGSETKGLLSILLEEPSGDFIDEVSVYAQLLGLGLNKTYLYGMIVEHSRRDGLTNLYLRRVFLERLNDEINFSRRYGTSFSIMLLDLDHFKTVNDTYGHLIGDKVLKKIADFLKSTLHSGVTISRYGGEEFAILIGLAPAHEVVETAEHIRSSIEKLVLMFADDSSSKQVKIGKRQGEIKITLSIGVAHYMPDTPTPDELIRRADAALYWAKEANRNCVREWKSET